MQATVHEGPIKIVVASSGLHVIGPHGCSPASVFAFQLFRDGERCAGTRYSRNIDTVLGWPSIAGIYQAVRFERCHPSGDIIRLVSRKIRLPSADMYDPARWDPRPTHHRGVRSLRPVNGIHRLVDEGVTSIDVLLAGMERSSPDRPLLVCFSASVPDRSSKVAPFFSGVALAEACGLPLLAFSDPAVARSRDVALGWYAGTDDHPALPQRISEVIDHIAQAAGARRAVLVGGSGGGFAALSIQPHLAIPSNLLVWNPQTTISRYYGSLVSKYLCVAFPELAVRHRLPQTALRALTPELLSAVLGETSVVHELFHSAVAQRRPSLYLQNRSDALHVREHLGRYLPKSCGDVLAAIGQITLDGMTYCIAEWGEGHVAPRQESLASMVSRLARGESPTSIASDFARTAVSSRRSA